MLSFLQEGVIQRIAHERLGGVGKPRRLKGGLLNQNYLVQGKSGKFILKIYRPEMPKERVDETHCLMRFADRHGIPVALPMDESMHDGHFVVGYPFIEGEHPRRYQNTHARLGAMGVMLGRIHAALPSFQPKASPPREGELLKAWDVKRSLAKIANLRERLKAHPLAIRQEMEGVLRSYERVIGESVWDHKFFSGAAVGFMHGDYHMLNLLMRKDTVTAVLDWEKAGWQYRSFEIMRSIIFNCRERASALSWPRVETYVRGYRQQMRIGAAEASLSFECGFRNLVFSHWALEQYLAGHGNWRLNILRRRALMETLAKNREAYAERIAGLLSGSH